MKKIVAVVMLGAALFVLYGMFKSSTTATIDPAAQKPRTGADKTGEKPEKTGGNPKDRSGSKKQDKPEPKPGDTGAGWPYDHADVPTKGPKV